MPKPFSPGLPNIVAIVVMLSMLSSAHTDAAPATSELAILQQIPARVLDTATDLSEPAADGSVQLNQGHWTDIVYQRVAIPLIWVGVAENNTAKINDGWKAIDFANAHITADGGFTTAPGRSMNEAEMAFWIEAVTHAFAVLNESPLRAQYAQRESDALAYIRRNVNWINTDRRVAALLQFDGPATNRLFTDANAFGYAALLLNDSSLQPRAEFFLAQALQRQRSDGVFLEEKGFDSSYQGVSLLHGTYYALLGENGQLRSALLTAANREVEAVDDVGRLDTSQNTRTGGTHMVNGQPYPVDLRSVILGLYYTGAYLSIPSATAAAGRLYTHRFQKS